MAAPTTLHPDLMPSLRQLVRGLELLFWSLPFALLVCVQEMLAPAWESWGIMPLLLSMALLWFGASRLKHFQPQEGIWQSAVKITEVLALVMVGLSPVTVATSAVENRYNGLLLLAVPSVSSTSDRSCA